MMNETYTILSFVVELLHFLHNVHYKCGKRDQLPKKIVVDIEAKNVNGPFNG